MLFTGVSGRGVRSDSGVSEGRRVRDTFLVTRRPARGRFDAAELSSSALRLPAAFSANVDSVR